MTTLKILLLLAMGLILAGCASSVSRKIETTAAPQWNTPIKAMTVAASLTDEAKQQIAAEIIKKRG